MLSKNCKQVGGIKVTRFACVRTLQKVNLINLECLSDQRLHMTENIGSGAVCLRAITLPQICRSERLFFTRCGVIPS